MNTLETIFLGLLEGAEAEAPIFIHSTQGSLILNASETLLGSVISMLAAKAAAKAAAPVASTAPIA